MNDAAFVGAKVGENNFLLETDRSLGGIIGYFFESFFATFLVVVDVEVELRPDGKALEDNDRENHTKCGETFAVMANKDAG